MAPNGALGCASRLVGGSRGPAVLPACQQCGVAAPAHRCAGCSSVAYCSRPCQQRHWVAGHKLECKLIRKQRQQAAELGSAAAGDGGGVLAAATTNGAAGSPGQPSDSNRTPPIPRQVLFPSERYAELAAAPPHRKQPLGLQNVGNSCYANSLLQALLATPPLASFLVTGQHSHGCVKASPSDWCVLCELEQLARAAHATDAPRVLNPRSLLRHVKRLGKQFTFGKQEDSHELFLQLVQAVEAVQLQEAGGGKAGGKAFDLRSRETCLIHHVFGGYTRNEVQCRACGHVSRTYELTDSLTLEVSPRITSLDAALRSFTAVERLDGVNRFQCDGCKAKVAADRSTRLEAAPHCLQFCLKRFAPGRHGKITSRLSFPEALDLAPYMAARCLDSDPVRYTLYAVVVHIDWARSTDYGHYIAYVKSGGAWFQCDDSTVKPVAATKVLSCSAYLLFYEREAPRRVQAAGSPADATATTGAAAMEPSETGAGMEGVAPSLAGLQTSSSSTVQTAQEGQSDAAMPEHLPTGASGSAASAATACSPKPDAVQQPGQEPVAVVQQQALEASAVQTAAVPQTELPARLEKAGKQSDGSVDTGSARSSSSDLGFAAMANPYDLLVNSDGQGGEMSSSEDDRGSLAVGGRTASSGFCSEFESEDGGEQRGGADDLGRDPLMQELGNAQPGVQQHPCMSFAMAAQPEQAAAALQVGAGSLQAHHVAAGSLHPDGIGTQPAANSTSYHRVRTPRHRASIALLSGTRVLRLSVYLPGVQHEAHVDWRLAATADKDASLQELRLRAGQHALRLPLPVQVTGDATATWVPSQQKLTVAWQLA